MLRTLVLTLHHDAGGEVDDAHRRVRHIDMLTAMAASAERLDPEVGFTDDDLDVILNLWDHEHRRKGGMPTVVGIERREADEAMHTGFGLGIPVGVFPLDEHGGALDARLFPR